MTTLHAVLTPHQVEVFLDAVDELVEQAGPCGFSVAEVCARLGWPVSAVLPVFPSTWVLYRDLVDRARGVYAFRLRAAGLQPPVVTWLLDHDPTTALSLAYALDRTGGEDAWDLPIGLIPVAAP